MEVVSSDITSGQITSKSSLKIAFKFQPVPWAIVFHPFENTQL